MNNANAVVTTQPQATIKEFVNQRLRWAGKLSYNNAISTKLLGWFIIVFQASYIAIVIFLITEIISIWIGFPLVATKLIVEFIFLKRVSSFLDVKWRTSTFLALQILYPLYVVGIGIFSNFIPYHWKGRKYRI
jgi:hypothetical protein